MIKKILIAEDHESVNLSVQKTLEDLGIVDIDYVYYCDDALIKIQQAKQTGCAYDLLITDLSFDEDYRTQRIKNGEALIVAAQKIQVDLKILVFSAEGRPTVIQELADALHIDGFVRKARGDAKELRKALDHIGRNQRYFTPEVHNLTKQKNAYEFSELDITILSEMVNGKKQQEISDYLKENNFIPASKSSIEKRLNYMKDALSFSTNEQLIAHCIKMGIL